MQQLAIFASGGGSNARKIMEYFNDNPDVRVALVISNKKTAPVLEIAGSHGIPTLVIDRAMFYETEELLGILTQHRIDFIALAGFLWLIPPYLVGAYKGRMVNIHPALLPKYGGKGMYGHHVHEAVKAAGETETGLTIHFVNAEYDEGAIVFQARCPVDPADTPEIIAAKVLALEHRHYPEVLAGLLAGSR
ncbi:MAG: phosphoribosylglycinamide formyltransferase [Lewinellaceae bacterium]|nr:phosphoribosylglycinamide formyltransferase [Saprospiraceae bacterium]MCB9329966.1 phosphoribosylglycinamide formyltransferase [Lewinellaceae bacterium]